MSNRIATIPNGYPTLVERAFKLRDKLIEIMYKDNTTRLMYRNVIFFCSKSDIGLLSCSIRASFRRKEQRNGATDPIIERKRRKLFTFGRNMLE